MKSFKEKVKINFVKNKKYILAFLVLWIFVVAISTHIYRDTLGKKSSGNGNYDHILYFNEGEITQTLDVIDEAKTISLFLSISDKENSYLNVKVIGNDSNTTYVDTKIKDRSIQNDSYKAIVLDYPLDIQKDKSISITISSENETKNNLGIWCSNIMPFGENTMSINGEKTIGNITGKLLNDDGSLKMFGNIIISIAGIFGIVVILYLFLFEPKKEKLFALIALLLGLIFIIIIVPISGPDEDYHYKQALRVSNKIMLKEDVTKIEDVYLDYEGLSTQSNNCRAYVKIIEELNEPTKDLSNRPIVDIPENGVYSYELCYVPHALGITLGRLFKMNFLNTYYAGRMFSLLFYVLCVYVSVKNTPILKNAFGIVALFPMLIQQSITYTIDSWICSLSMVLFAFFLKWKFIDEKISKKDYLFVLIVDLLLAPAKYIYSLLAILFFLIPENRFGSKKNKIFLIGLLLTPTIYVMGRNLYYKLYPIIANPTISDTNGQIIEVKDEMIEQLIERNDNFSVRYALLNPIKTVKIVINTIKAQLKTWTCTAVARALSGGSLLISLEVVYGFMIIAIAATLQKESYSLNLSNKLIIVLICIVISGLIMASMLVGWTKYNDDVIKGIQGRYFSPMIIYLLSIVNNKKIFITKNIDKYLIMIELMLSFEIIIQILSFTFVN